jgi:hypothetical protein
MAKKLSLLIAAMAVLAFAVPAMASATAPLTESNGTVVVPVGSGITGTSTNAKTKTSLGTLSCKKVELMGKVTVNEESTKGPKAEGGAGEEEFTGSECEVEGVSVPVKKIKLTNLKTGSGLGLTTGTGTATFSFTALIGSFDCVFTGTNVPFTYSTTTMTNSIKFTNASLTGSPAACGTGTFSGDFELFTTGTNTKIEVT